MAIVTLSKLLTLFTVFTHMEKIILSQKQSIDPGKLTSNKLNKCQSCKVLTDSFNTWLTRTSRGKHEGGDVAWEEAKLKSYSRSEMRLIEIQEGLCSELKTHKDHCYMLAEEVEQVLEKWWFNKSFNDSDLYNWLCYENLQFCCPPYHFGEACTPCPRDKNNKICGGKGECDGDGTRKGNGSCICKSGYSGNNCEDCASNFYNTMNVCRQCHQACNECHSDGRNACVQCASGWSMESGVCIDVNECLDLSVCKASEFCINRDGSYDCRHCDVTCSTCVGPGPTDCTSCTSDKVLWIGKCKSSDHIRNLLENANKRDGFYFCLCIIVIIIIYRKWSLAIASFIALVLAFLIYYFGYTSDNKLIDV